MMAAAVRESMTVAGRAARAGQPALSSALYSAGTSLREVAVLLVSELFGDSVRHSGSNDPGETITVSVTALDAGAVQVDVADRSVPACPAACGRK